MKLFYDKLFRFIVYLVLIQLAAISYIFNHTLSLAIYIFLIFYWLLLFKELDTGFIKKYIHKRKKSKKLKEVVSDVE